MAVLGRTSRAASVIAWSSRCVLSLLFLAGVYSKMIDPLTTTRAVHALSWPIVSANAGVTVSFLAGAEFLVAILLLLLPNSRAVAVIAIVLLAIFTIALARMLGLATTPSCGCMGWLFPSGDPRQQAVAGLVRNAGMLGMLACLLYQSGISFISRSTATRRSPRDGGYTLVEVLVCIAILAVLIALLSPALSGTRQQGKYTQALSGLSEVTIATMMYASDNADGLPYVATPERPWELLIVEGVPIPNVPYFAQSEWVLSVLVPEYIDDRGAVEFSSEAGELGPVPVFGRYELTHTAFASRFYWRGDVPPDDLKLYRGTRIRDIVFPSSKGLFKDNETSAIRIRQGSDVVVGPWSIGRADGGAMLLADSEATYAEFGRPYGALPWPIMSTRDGLAGRDF